MKMGAGFAAAVFVLAAAGDVCAQGDLEAQKVHLSPWGGLQFGGSLLEIGGEDRASLDDGFAWGGVLEVEVAPNWRFAMLYSRHETTIEGTFERPLLDLTVERYMVGIQEEKGDSRARWFGSALVGATRFVPRTPVLGSDLRFAAGLELGVKYFVSSRLALRGQVRGFYTVVDAEGGALCANGTCLFAFSGSGLWQGDVSGGLLLAF